MSSERNYASAGVNIASGEEAVDRIKRLAADASTPEMLSDIGGFGALCALPTGYQEPVLVAGADGVGTKLILATRTNRHEGIGIDLVAMCANDILAHGAKPLMFLDYYACGSLCPSTVEGIVAGIAEGCRRAGCALAGGETAELPGMYEGKDYDLAGFCVGVVEKSLIIRPELVKDGDALIGLKSSGPHSNGYSLIRKVIDEEALDLDEKIDDGRSLGEALMTPTEIYVKDILALLGAVDVHGIAHITGGGIPDNLPRILPDGLGAEIDTTSWARPQVFDLLQSRGGISSREMWQVFNCGLGMIVAVAADDAGAAVELLGDRGCSADVVGRVVASDSKVSLL